MKDKQRTANKPTLFPKLISLFLALVMVAALIPAVSMSARAETAPESMEFSYAYDVQRTSTGSMRYDQNLSANT
ncbi:MAG: hypothetical protein PUC32_04280, partial [Oscillospiraceae bacterium]|nr:hypothetical protein [Oscillospiraceae bacterium]